MSYIFAILAVPLLSATGVYDPDVMRHGRCMAEPGNFDALYCTPGATTPTYHRHGKKHARR
jgi:hypothetical protein